MASVVHAKKQIKQHATSIPIVVETHCRPTKIPVCTGYRSRSSSEDSDEQTSRIKSSEMRQSPRASRLPVRTDIVPGSKMDEKDMRTSDEVRPSSRRHREMRECLSINQARCNEAIEQGLKQVLPGIMKKLLAQEVESKDEGLPKKRKQDKPRKNYANRKTSAQNIPVPRKTSTTGKRVNKKKNLPTNKRQNDSKVSSASKLSLKNAKETCMSDSFISGNSVKTDKYETDWDGLTYSEPESVPQKAQTESEDLSDGKEKQNHEADLENFAHSEPLSVHHLVQREEDDVLDEADKAGASLNDYILKHEHDSDWLTEFDLDIEDLIKQAHSEDDQDVSEREDEAEKTVKVENDLSTYSNLKHSCQIDSDGLSNSDLETLPKQEQSKNEDDVLDEADKARDSLHEYILKYEHDSDWLTEFDLDIEDLIKQAHSEDDQDVSDSQDKNGKAVSDGEHSLSTYSSLKHSCKTDSDWLTDSDLESLPKQVESESEEASDKPLSDCAREYNYDADVDGMTDSEPECIPNQVQMESDFSNEQGKEGNPNVSPSNTRLELSLESESDGYGNSVPENLPRQVQNEEEVLSVEEAKAQESSHSIILQNLECKLEAVLDDFASPSGSDPESNIKNIRSDQIDEFQEEGSVEPSESGSSIGSKLRRFSIEIETDGFFSTDSESGRVSKDAELKILSDDDDIIKVPKNDKVTLPFAEDEKFEDNLSWEGNHPPSGPEDITTSEQVIELGLLTDANETNEKQEPTKYSKTFGNDNISQSSRGGEGNSAGQYQGGANPGQGSTAGGSGGDDPNDPRKPKPRKDPEDKKDRDEEKERRKAAAKKALIDQVMGITSNLLQNQPHGKQPVVETPTQIVNNTNPVAEDKASQTKEEERVETLLKTIQSKDREIVMMQNLVDCCRKDYEDLQESFNGYIDEFTEVDQLRDLISAMYTDNSILRHDNQKIKNQLYQKTEEAAQAYDRNKKYKDKISKMEADLDSLKSAKEELSKKLKSYAATPPREGQKDKTDKEQTESALSKTCSLQNVEAMKIEEENQALKRKLEQCETSLKAQKKGNTELKDKLAKQNLAQKQLESKIRNLAEENKILSSKCSQFQKQISSEISLEEIVRDLRILYEEISEARKDLASANTVEKPELKGPTLSPLSIELAQADDRTLQPQPEVNPGTELHTLTYSLTALTEELREQITQSKVRIAKAYCDNDYSELETRSNEKMRELNEEIAGLHGKLDEEAEKFKDLEGLVTISYTESDRLNEWITELQQELSSSEDMLNQTVTENDQKLDELKSALDMKDQKLKGMMIQHQNLLEADDALRGVIHTLNMNGAASSSKIMQLENYLGELESENEKLFKQLCERKTNLNKIQQENEERQAFSVEEVEQLHYALQNKTESLVDILDTVNQMAANHPEYHDHPCVSAIENGLQLVYDVTDLLKAAVGHAYMPRNEYFIRGKDLCGPLLEETREKELKIMVENLQEENKKLQEDMQRLENILKRSKARYLDERDENINDEVGDMEANLVRKSSSEIINELEKQLQDRQDSEIELQQRANALRLQIRQFEAEKREADKKVQELMDSNHVKTLKEKQNLKLDLQKEKQNAERKAKDQIKLIRQKSQEKVTALEKSLEERSNSETKLEDKVLSLEARISQLNAEKAEREENIKIMCEAVNAGKNLEEKLREKEDVEKKLVKKVEDLKLKISRVRAAKKTLRSELAKMHLQNRTSSTATRNQLLKLKKELVECTEREKELQNNIRKLTEEREKAEGIMEAKVTLIKKSSQEKMEDLEELLRKKSHSELELQEQKTSLEQELVRLEKERSEHTRIISAILRAVKAKQELAKAFNEKCKTEKDYKAKLDEIEIVINKLKAEKNKPNCNVALKEKYKGKYFELRRIVRKLEEDLNSQNKRVEELQSVVLTAVEDEDKSGEARESTDLRRSIESLKDTLKTNHACEIKLYKTLQSLNSRILVIENEKAEGEKMMKGLLQSMEGLDTLHQGPAASKTGTDKAFLRLIGEVIEGVHRLRQVKQRVEEDLVNFENMIATARSETEVLQNQSFERISDLELSLKEKNISETELQERLKSMDKKVADLENEKYNADMGIQAMLESLKSKDELEKLLKQKEDIENILKQKVLGLEEEKKQNEMQVKLLQQQVHDLKENKKTTDTSKDFAQQMHMLNNNKEEMEKYKKDFKVQFDTSDLASGSCLHKIKQVTQQLQQQNDLEEELRQVVESLTKQKKELEEEKKAYMEEKSNVVSCLNNTNLELEAANRERQKLSVEVDELKSDNLSSARNSRRLVEELTRREKELLKEIDEMKQTIKTMGDHRYHSPSEINQERMELKIKIAELENKNDEHSAKNKKHQHEQISESKRAKAKIQDLNLHLQQRMQFEDHLKSDIKVLNVKVSEMGVQIRNEKMRNVEIEKLYGMSKNRITELEHRIACKQEQIDSLRKSSEELRGQVVRLHEEKNNLAGALEDNYHLKLEQRDMQIQQLKNKLEEQEEKMRESTRRHDDLTQYRGQMFMDTSRGESSGLHTNEDQRNTTKVIIKSLIDTERRIGKLKSSWKQFEELQNRSPLNTSIDSILTRNNTTNSSYYRPSN